MLYLITLHGWSVQCFNRTLDWFLIILNQTNQPECPRGASETDSHPAQHHLTWNTFHKPGCSRMPFALTGNCTSWNKSLFLHENYALTSCFMHLRMPWKTESVTSSSIQGQQWDKVCLFREKHYKRSGNQVIQEKMALCLEKKKIKTEKLNIELYLFPTCSKLHYLCIAVLQACKGPINQYITQFPII